jgi:hypothetical protein
MKSATMSHCKKPVSRANPLFPLTANEQICEKGHMEPVNATTKTLAKYILRQEQNFGIKWSE